MHIGENENISFRLSTCVIDGNILFGIVCSIYWLSSNFMALQPMEHILIVNKRTRSFPIGPIEKKIWLRSSGIFMYMQFAIVQF